MLRHRGLGFLPLDHEVINIANRSRLHRREVKAEAHRSTHRRPAASGREVGSIFLLLVKVAPVGIRDLSSPSSSSAGLAPLAIDLVREFDHDFCTRAGVFESREHLGY